MLFAATFLLATAASADTPVTFSKDVAPILFSKCVTCHRPDGAAPFSLLTYATARAHATQIAAATSSGFMPPWKADPGVGVDFVGQPHLTDAEHRLIQQWVDGGAIEGDPRDVPPAPTYTAGWQLGQPDLVVEPPPYTLHADGTDVFRVFVVRLPVTTLKFVRGLEFHPGNPKVVHHANIRIDRTNTSRAFDDADAAPGYSGLIARTAMYPDGHFLGWTPGQVAPLLPKGLAWRLTPGTDLVVELHMQPSGREEAVHPSVGLYFTDDPPERIPSMLRLGRQSIDIAPGTTNYTITDSFVLPVDVTVQAVQPHAHNRAREIIGSATLPDGTERPLIHIKDWDFRWQHVYRYVQPFALPKGTRLSMRYTYDNSDGNPRNPDRPARRVYWGQRSADEMGDLWIQVLTGNDRDLETLDRQFAPKVMAEDVIGYERWIQSDPDSVPLHDDLGVLYLRLNRPQDAVRHFTISARVQPDSAAAHFNLGTALTMTGNASGAISEYQRALELKPDYTQAHNNLGGILFKTGRFDEALTHFAEALRIDPANADAQYNTGTAMQQQGRTAEAIAYFTQAVRLNGNWAAASADLAWLLAVIGDDALRDPVRAVQLAERAVMLTGRQDAAAFDVLAAAYASAGDYDRAIDAAQSALNLNPANATQIAARRDLYKSHRPYRR